MISFSNDTTKSFKFYNGHVREYIVLSDIVSDKIKKITLQALELRDKDAKDAGTCVMDAGIKISIMYPSIKKPVLVTIIKAPFQGNIGSYKALKPCLEYLINNYPELHPRWDDGYMD